MATQMSSVSDVNSKSHTREYKQAGEYLKNCVALAAKGDPFSEFHLVDPIFARCALQMSDGNRPESSAFIEQLVRDIVSGKYVLTHQGPAWDVKGRLFDGHHTLHAIIRANVSVKLNLTFGLPVEAAGACDSHKSRRLQDRVFMATGTKLTNMETAIGRFLLRLESDIYGGSFSDGEILASLEKYKPSLVAIGGVNSFGRPASAATWAVIVGAHGTEPELSVRFASELVHGVGLEASSPSFRLREYCLAPSGKKLQRGRGGEVYRGVLTIVALRAAVECRTITKLGVRDLSTPLEWYRDAMLNLDS